MRSRGCEGNCRSGAELARAKAGPSHAPAVVVAHSPQKSSSRRGQQAGQSSTVVAWDFPASARGRAPAPTHAVSPFTIDSRKGLMITIVSGLPRSGTSLMMQMLAAGGMPILSDGERRADVDNPRGYLEWERIKQLPKDPACIAEAEGKAVKVISQLLLSLPAQHEYRVIFMQRPLPEVMASQDEMLRRRGNFDPGRGQFRGGTGLSGPSVRRLWLAQRQTLRESEPGAISRRLTRSPRKQRRALRSFWKSRWMSKPWPSR